MKFRVLYTARAERDLYQIVHWLTAEAPASVERWLTGLEAAVDSLEVFPERCAVAPESSILGIELRQRLYGRYRIIFRVTGKEVVILHVRHGHRQIADAADLQPPDDPASSS